MKMKSADLGRSTKADGERKADMARILTAIYELSERLDVIEKRVEKSSVIAPTPKEEKKVFAPLPPKFRFDIHRDRNGLATSIDCCPVKEN